MMLCKDICACFRSMADDQFCSVATCIGGESETYLQISWRADLHVGQASECICSSRRIALFDAGTIERKDA